MSLTQKKLRPELERWTGLGLVTPENAGKILGQYPAGDRNYWIIAFAAIGSVLCLTGVSLILASNWQEIPGVVKLAGLLILLAGSMALGIESQKRGWHRSWWECAYLAAAVFPLLGMMLISQIFHTHGEPRDAMLAWMVVIAPLPLLSRSVSSFVAWILSGMSLLICLVDDRILIDSFEGSCLAFVVFGLALALLSQLWTKLNEPIQRDVGEFWGVLMAVIAAYVLGFDIKPWLLIWFLIFLFCLGLIYRGYRVEKTHQVNMGFVMVAILILSIFFRLVGTMMNTGLLFIAGGAVLLGVVYGINRLRRRVLEKMS
jgi:uncharacterized membrane protein